MSIWDGMTERRIMRQEKLDQIHVAIFGNGHPEEGLVWKVKSNTEFISAFNKIFWRVLNLVILGCIGAIGSFLITIFKMVYHIN